MHSKECGQSRALYAYFAYILPKKWIWKISNKITSSSQITRNSWRQLHDMLQNIRFAVNTKFNSIYSKRSNDWIVSYHPVKALAMHSSKTKFCKMFSKFSKNNTVNVLIFHLRFFLAKVENMLLNFLIERIGLLIGH